MKVIKKEVRECTTKDGTPTTVLILDYTHKKKSGQVMVKDYDDSTYAYVLKQLKKAIAQGFALFTSDKK